jgi:hypothetical protein
MLPLCFISDVFQPIDNAPHWLRSIASFFPLRSLADDLESAFNPITGTSAIHPAHLELMALWGLVAAVFALVAFRWEPDGRHRDDRGSRRRAVFAADRLRGLLEPRGQGEPRPRRREATRLTEPPKPRRADRSAEARTEWIEGPAPAEDSSVPPETAALPPSAPGRSL